jgi:hypothetical protein
MAVGSALADLAVRSALADLAVRSALADLAVGSTLPDLALCGRDGFVAFPLAGSRVAIVGLSYHGRWSLFLVLPEACRDPDVRVVCCS